MAEQNEMSCVLTTLADRDREVYLHFPVTNVRFDLTIPRTAPPCPTGPQPVPCGQPAGLLRDSSVRRCEILQLWRRGGEPRRAGSVAALEGSDHATGDHRRDARDVAE